MNKIIIIMIVMLLLVPISVTSTKNLNTIIDIAPGTTTTTPITMGNPNYGVIKGILQYKLMDGETIIEIENASGTEIIWLVPQNTTVDWISVITQTGQIDGNLANLDADDAGIYCTPISYQHTTKIYSAKNIIGENITIYGIAVKSTEDNLGCYAGKLLVGAYDMYV